ncbi:hypothetical protein ACRTDU_07300 [Sunxiuqinia elliptica]
MIRHEIKNEYLKVYLRENSSPYSIPLCELGQTTDWRVAVIDDEKIIAKNISKWTLHLFTDKNLTIEFAREFQRIVKKNCPTNTINWEETEKAIIIYDEYRRLSANVKEEKIGVFSSLKNYDKNAYKEIIKKLKKKYNLD